MAFVKATKKKSKLRMAITGPSGSGKTFTSLRIAKGLGEKIALIEIDRFQDYQKKDGKKNEKFAENSRGEPGKGWGQFN